MFDADPKTKPERIPKPRDAATLILVRRTATNTQILMGQRHAGHVFMPNKFVFPGGRVDIADTRLRAPQQLRPNVQTRAAHGTNGARAQALGLAAVRETFEETGLRLAHPHAGGIKSRSKSWAAFCDGQFAPTLNSLDFVFRAITPPQRNRRFDTRFFIADADEIHGDCEDLDGASGELIKLRWIPLQETFSLDLPSITRAVLEQLRKRLATNDPASLPVPFVFMRHGKMVTEEI